MARYSGTAADAGNTLSVEWKQTPHDPENGIYGNCNQLALAWLLGYTPNEVPHFFCDKHYREGIKRRDEWLAERGLYCIALAYAGAPDKVLKTMENLNPGVHYLMIGYSGQADHVVVCCGGKVVYDPAGRDPSLKGPTAHDGNTWVEFIVKEDTLFLMHNKA